MMITMNFILLALVVVVFVAINQTSAGNYPIQLDNGLIPVGNTTLSRGNLDSSTDTKLLKRSKRWYLIWSGISKCVLGMLMPVETRDNVNWRTLNMAHNFQAQFQVLPSIIWPWKVFARSLREQRRKFDEHGTYEPDETRSFVYNALELYMGYKKIDGRQCLLKAICEAAKQPIEQRTVFDEVVHTVLTPNRNEVQDHYLDAMHAGGFGADCSDLYPKCSPGKGLLDSISYYF